jgi:hypothetical protein
MRMKHLAGVLVVGLIVGVTGGAMGQSNDAAIRASLRKIETGDARAMVAGRQELVDLYAKASATAKPAVAGDVAKLSLPLINKLSGIRAIHLGNAIAAIHDAATQPALEAMVVHKDESVRLLGWRGYAWIDPDARVDGVRAQLLRQNSDGAALMWRTLATRMASETSPVVLGSMVEMMRLLPLERRDLGTSAAAVDAANLALLDKAWSGLCQKIVDGDEELTRTARSVLMTLEYFFRTGNADQQNHVTRCFVEMMYCAAKSFDLDSAQGDLAEAARQVVLDADKLIRDRTSKQLAERKSLAAALKDEDPGAAVVLSAIAWGDVFGVDMNNLAVTYPPKSRVKAAVQQPTSRPAATVK